MPRVGSGRGLRPPLYFPAEVFFTAASAVLLLSTAAFALSNATRAALLLAVTAARAASMFTKNALGLLRLRSSCLGSRSPTPFAFPFAFVGALDAVVEKLLHVLFSRCRVYWDSSGLGWTLISGSSSDDEQLNNSSSLAKRAARPPAFTCASRNASRDSRPTRTRPSGEM